MGKFVGKNSGIAAILGFGIYEPKDAPLTLKRTQLTRGAFDAGVLHWANA